MKMDFEFVNHLQMEIIYGAFVQLDQRWKRERVCDAYTRLYFVQSGDGYLRMNGQEIKLEPGYLYIIPAGCRFDYGCTHLSKLFFHLMLKAIEGIDLLSAIQGICKLPMDDGEIERLLKWCISDDYADILQLKTYLYQRISACMRLHTTQKIPVRKYSEHVVRAVAYIQENLRLNLSITEMAQVLFVSESKLRKDFRNEIGMSIGKYMDNLVFLRAKQLLTDKTLSIGQISQRLGFCDQFYFSRRFKEIFQQTPSEYREEIR